MNQYLSQLQLPELGYEYHDLEPYINSEIMHLHHQKHHMAYINGLKSAIDKIKDESSNIQDLLKAQTPISFNAGGHINHSIFWTNLKSVKDGGGIPPTSGEFIKDVNSSFGSVGKLIEKMSESALSIKGSGWCWLTYDVKCMCLSIKETMNQDCPYMFGLVPLLGIDVWEHSYYLQYKNVRADYICAIWNVINWENVNKRYNEVTKNSI